MSTFTDNWNFQLSYYQQVERILKDNAMHFIKVSVATPEQDMKRATDFVVTIEGGEIAVRIRRHPCGFRDLTIRAVNGGYKTELAKIIEGWARYYLYCWEDSRHILSEWMLVDLDKVRLQKLLENKDVTMNTDTRTGFISIPFIRLDRTGCVIANTVI